MNTRLTFFLAVLAIATNSPPASAADAQSAAGGGLLAPSVARAASDAGVPADLRKWLADRGVSTSLVYINDVLSNLRGGERRGTVDQGKAEGLLSVDLEKLAGLPGLSFFGNALQIHNTGRIRRDYVAGVNTIASIEAVPSTRLSELWFEQKFFGDAASVRFGQLAADVEFFFSNLSGMFLQSDWATIIATNLPSGGPAYPLSTPGVRFKFDPSKEASLLLGVFNGDPAGPGPGDEQLRNRYGLNFRLQDPAFIIAEAQFRTNQGKADTGLARTLKLGGWRHLGEFDDKRFANDGTFLADPEGSGVAARRRGNSGLYAVIDQQLYRPKGGDWDSGISAFGRISVSPSDRNLIDFFVDGGIVFAGLIPYRPLDRFGASFIYSRFSDGVRAFDRDTAAFTGEPIPIRDYEANLEFTYLAAISPSLIVQPVLTYVWHPSGDANRNATVIGGRTIWRF